MKCAERISLAVCAALLVLPGTAAADLGSSTVGSHVGGKASGRAESYRFTATAGVVDRLSVYLDATNGASKVVLGLYSNGSKGQPRQLRRSCTVRPAVGNAWNRCSISALTLTRGATYHLVILGPKGTRRVRYRTAIDRLIASYGSRSRSLVRLPRFWSGRSRLVGHRATVHAARATLHAEKLRVGPPPTAEFTWSPLNPQNPPAQVSFTNTGKCSAAPCTYRWEQPELFATTKDASFTYQSATTKAVKLTVTDARGRVAAQTKTVTVTGPPPPLPDPPDNDVDGDGVSDLQDACPNEPGPASASGCPDPPTGQCVSGTPNTPDGPDPFGGCWPGPATTGVPDNVTLTNYTGPCTVTTPNTVIVSKTINCDLNVNATGVVVRNTKVNGRVDTASSGSLTISDSTIDAGDVNSTVNDGPRALNGSNFTATRVETLRGISGGYCEVNCTVQDSWIHGQDRDEGGHAHASGFRMENTLTLRHNSLRCDAPTVDPDAGCSADLTGYGDFAPIRNNLIERNLFLATVGGICAYGGSSGDNGSKPYGNQAANIVFRDNVFQRRSVFQSSGKCGVWGPITDFDSARPGNQWTNNRWDDGSIVPPAN